MRAKVSAVALLSAVSACALFSTSASAAFITGTPITTVPAPANLSELGELDWAYWSSGSASGVASQAPTNRMADTTALIGDVTAVGGGSVRGSSTKTSISVAYSDGVSPTSSAGVTIAGAFNTGIGIQDRGVEVSVVLPDTQQYQVTLFVSGFYAVGEFTASLAGAIPYVDDSFSYDGGTKPGRAYEIIAQADNPGDVLSFTYVATTIRENNSNGHVLIGAVAISAVPEPTSLALLAPLGVLALRRRRA